MSITFFAPAEERTVLETYECQCVWDDGPPNPKCPVCNGSGKVEFSGQAHEVNMANGNAMPFLYQLGLGDEYCGEVKKEDIPSVKRKLIQILNKDSSNRALQEEGYKDKEPGKCTIIQFGRDEDYVNRRATALLKLFTFAQETNDCVVWG